VLQGTASQCFRTQQPSASGHSNPLMLQDLLCPRTLVPLTASPVALQVGWAGKAPNCQVWLLSLVGCERLQSPPKPTLPFRFRTPCSPDSFANPKAPKNNHRMTDITRQTDRNTRPHHLQSSLIKQIHPRHYSNSSFFLLSSHSIQLASGIQQFLQLYPR
jgi:hypothetical protein